MAVTDGTNAGYVSSAPSSDPNGGGESAISGRSRATKFVAPADMTITQMGVYVNVATEAANMQLGIYSHNSGADEPDVRLATSGDFAKGTDAGWKTAAVSYDLTNGTTYWLAVQIDTTATLTWIDNDATGGYRSVYSTIATTALPADWTGYTSGSSNSLILAIYALYESGAPAGAERSYINIGDSFRLLSPLYINISDSWRPITSAFINIGDAWKVIKLT